LGLRDGYKMADAFHVLYEQGNPVPKDGYDACNIMVNGDGTPDAGDIRHILMGDGYGFGRNPEGDQSGEQGRRSRDAFDSATSAAASWEATWGDGGWLAADRNFGR
jgi:hypothetical protein